MLSKNNRPNAQQKKWLADIAEFHCQNGLEYIYGSEFSGHAFQLHHVCGRSYKQDKLPIGHWFVIAAPEQLHDVMSNHPENVTHFRKRFTARFGNQRDIFKRMIELMERDGYQVPDKDVLQAIERTRY